MSKTVSVTTTTHNANGTPKVHLLRSQLAGVHIVELIDYSPTTRHAVVRNGHRIWQWRGANTLTELAIHGADMASYTRISERAPGEQIIADVFELLEVVDPAVIANLRTPRWLP